MKNLIFISLVCISFFSCDKRGDILTAPLKTASYEGIFCYNSDTTSAVCEFVADNERDLYGVIIKTPQGNSLYWESFSDPSIVAQTETSFTFNSTTQSAKFESAN
jgi:hypothetical protein